MKKAQNLNEFIDICKRSKCVVFGAKVTGVHIKSVLMDYGIDVEFFVDNYETGYEKHTNLKIIPPNKIFENCKESPVVILSIFAFDKEKSVCKQLKALGIADIYIYTLSEISDIFQDKNISWKKDKEKYFDLNSTQHRVRMMAEWIDEQDKSVIDFGAGNMFLKSLLCETVNYIPIDYVKRFPETIVCDFNADPFPDIIADVGFLSGIISYIEEPYEFIANLCLFIKRKVIVNLPSYLGSSIGKFNGSANNLTDNELIEIFKNNGFELKYSKKMDGFGMRFCFVVAGDMK